MKEAIVFVDANNWYHNIKHYFILSREILNSCLKNCQKKKK